jgi:SAM-dependent methyltransferase
MQIFNQAFSHISGGQVLDIATGTGDFTRVLKQHLESYTHITGIDIKRPSKENYDAFFSNKDCSFLQMNASQLAFLNNSFDTISISVSLHHLDDILSTLAEVLRVLKIGGKCIIAEMYKDGLNDPQETVKQIHHWAADIDQAHGISHNHTLARQDILDIIENLDLEILKILDRIETDDDPLEPKKIANNNKVLDMVLARAVDLPTYEVHKKRAQELRDRVLTIGTQLPSILIIVAQKL